MRRMFVLSFFTLAIALATPSFAGSGVQVEGSFATIFQGDAGYNLNINYTPDLPDRFFSVGGFWQWTFDADDIAGNVGGSDPDVMKLGGEVRFQKAINSFVPYIKGEMSWVRFNADGTSSINRFGIGPGAGLNFWLAPNFGFGAEVNTAFLFKRSNSPKNQITTLLVGPRLRF